MQNISTPLPLAKPLPVDHPTLLTPCGIETSNNRFLLTQKHLISGLPPDQRGDLGERFVAALGAEFPDLGAEEMASLAIASTSSSPSGGGGGADGAGASKGNSSDNGIDSRNRRGKSKKPKLWEKLKEGIEATESGPGTDGVVMTRARGGGENAGGGFSFGFAFT